MDVLPSCPYPESHRFVLKTKVGTSSYSGSAGGSENRRICRR